MKKIFGIPYQGKYWCVTYIDASNFYMLNDGQVVVSSANLSPEDFAIISAYYPQTPLQALQNRLKKLFGR
jgi:hypothetical protein